MADVIGFDPVAYSVDGGRHPGALFRTAQYAAGGPNEGVVSFADCRVHQLATPGRGIAIDPGAITMRNPDAKNQAYVANASALTTLDGPAATTAERSYIVLVRVEDPEFGWPEPSSAAAPTYQYVRPMLFGPVPKTTTQASQLNLGYSAYALARVDIPANTTTLIDGMITDLRKVANPRRDRFSDRYNILYSPNDGAETGSWLRYPDVPQPSILIPDWATQMFLRVDIDGVMARDSALSGNWSVFVGPPQGAGDAAARITGIPSGVIASRATFFNQQIFGDTVLHFLNSDKMNIPATMRGKPQTFSVRMNRNGGAGFFRSTSATQVVLDVEFLEVAS